MTVLKPLLCSWLFQAWHNINQLAMIRKGWTMYGLDQTFNKSFQTTVMDEHMRNPLFKEEKSQAEEISNDREDETDTNINIQTIMEESLIQGQEIAAINNKCRISILKDLIRKR